MPTRNSRALAGRAAEELRDEVPEHLARAAAGFFHSELWQYGIALFVFCEAAHREAAVEPAQPTSPGRSGADLAQ